MKPEQPTIGRILRALRAHRGWTLKQMSARCGIPLSTLSKVEHDRLSLTYDKLQMISQRLNMTMSELLAEPQQTTEQPVMARRSMGRIDDAVRVNTPNYDYYYLCPELRHKRMIPVLAHVRAKTLEQFGALVRHSGEEYTYVLEGRVLLHTEFYDPLPLEAGESVYIDSNMGHAYLAAEGCREAVVLCLCSSVEESLLETLLNLHAPNAARVSGRATPVKRSERIRRPRSKRKLRTPVL
ncbi:MAG: helix-turn-helix transcriptional regulator [Verrucomicrobia bacterium]|nr:helix-turn-helix transcriptional regulator [Verrucomicrobiota bacterium]